MGIGNYSNWESKYQKENDSIFVAPEISGGKALSLLGIEKEGDIYKDFIGKKVTDIGSGFGGFIFEIEKSCDHINAVDPLYKTTNKESILTRDKKRIKNMIEGSVGFLNTNEAKIKNIRNQINDLFLMPPTPKNVDEISALEKDLSMVNGVKRGLSGKKEVLIEMEMWEKRGFNGSNKISLIGNTGDNTGIDGNSQDFVFIKHLIDKITVDPDQLVAEALRITKPNGKIFIIDDIIKNEDKLLSILDGLNYNYKKKGNLIIIEIIK